MEKVQALINSKLLVRYDISQACDKIYLLRTGFIKSTDHRLTDHRPLTHQPTNHRPTDKITFKRLKNMKTFILQNVNTTEKMENFTSAYYLFEQDESL